MEINVQDVFNKVINEGYYPDTPFMCIALKHAYYNKKITAWEYAMAEEEIRAYLRGIATLYRRITGDTIRTPRAWANKEGVEIYRNWENRPRLSGA